jgi:hypothetical protein
VLAIFGVADFGQRPPRRGLRRLRQSVEHVGDLVNP